MQKLKMVNYCDVKYIHLLKINCKCNKEKKISSTYNWRGIFYQVYSQRLFVTLLGKLNHPGQPFCIYEIFYVWFLIGCWKCVDIYKTYLSSTCV